MAEGKSTAKSNTVGKATEKKLVNKSTKDADVLKWDMEGHTLLFSVDDLKVLSNAFVAELSEPNKERYLEAKATAAGREVQQHVSVESPLADLHAHKLKLPGRKGYHQTWIDGRFVDDYKAIGYTPVMRRKGEVLKFEETEKNGTKHDMVAMEIPEHLYNAHMRATYLRDKQAVEGHKESFKAEVDAINSRLGGRGKEVKPIVEEEDPEEVEYYENKANS